MIEVLLLEENDEWLLCLSFQVRYKLVGMVR